MLLWSLQAGPILGDEAANRGARIIILLIVLVAVIDVGSKLIREQARVRTPKWLRR